MINLTKRPRPAVADRNKATSRANIKEKIRALTAIVQHEDIEVRATGPHSTRQFCLWDTSKTEPQGLYIFGRTAPETLRSDKASAEAVKKLTAVCKAATLDVKSTKNQKKENVAALKRKVELHSSIRQIAESEMAAARRDLIAAQTRVSKLEAQLKSNSEASKQLVSDLESQVSNLMQENARLIAQLKNVVGIRRI